jgi:hypothetical protein
MHHDFFCPSHYQLKAFNSLKLKQDRVGILGTGKVWEGEGLQGVLLRCCKLCLFHWVRRRLPGSVWPWPGQLCIEQQSMHIKLAGWGISGMTPDLRPEFIACIWVPSKGRTVRGPLHRDGTFRKDGLDAPRAPHLIRCLSAYVVPTLWVPEPMNGASSALRDAIF